MNSRIDNKLSINIIFYQISPELEANDHYFKWLIGQWAIKIKLSIIRDETSNL